MNYRTLGRTGWKVSEISFGAWAIGGSWGDVSDEDSLAALQAALDGGVNFFDTADVYGDGRSERLMAKLKKERKEKFYVATKAGRRLPQQTPEGYSRKNLTGWIERSLKNLNTDALDLESSRNADVEDCTFDTGDDGICIKSGRDEEGRKRGLATKGI